MALIQSLVDQMVDSGSKLNNGFGMLFQHLTLNRDQQLVMFL